MNRRIGPEARTLLAVVLAIGTVSGYFRLAPAAEKFLRAGAAEVL